MQAQPNETWFAKAREVVVSAMDGGWTTLEIQKMIERVIQEENDARTAETARKLYGPAAKALDSTPEAVKIVAEAKLPRGKYGFSFEDGGSVTFEGAATRVVAAALHTGETCRLYRDADGWRFVGIIHADGRFTDERSWADDERWGNWS